MGSPDGPQRLSDVLAQEYESLGRTPGRAGESASADEAARLRAQRAQVHGFERPLAGLCISGGGIRSATFALGALQGLAQRGLLGQFDYLSTVSGGGYIGSWLSAWIHRAGGIDRVLPHLAGRPAEEPGAAAQHDPIQHLREFNNFLTPRLGFASADTWTLAAIVIRNLLLNWLVIVPLLMAVLMIPRILVAALQVDSPFDADPPGFGRIEVTVTLVGLAIGLWSNFQKMRFLPSMGNEPHDDATFVNRCFLPMVASTLLAAVGMWWWWSDGAPRPGLLATVVATVVLSLLALVGYLLVLQRSHGLSWMARQLFGTAGAGGIVFGVCVGAAIYLLTHPLLLKAQSLFNTTGPALYATLAPSLLLSALFLGASFGEGLTSRAMGDSDREWLSRDSAFLLLALLGWLGLGTVVLVLPAAVLSLEPRLQAALAASGGLAAWVTVLGGRSPNSNPTAATGPPPPSTRAMDLAARAALPVFLVALMVGLSLLSNAVLTSTRAVSAGLRWADHLRIVNGTSLPVALGTALALLGLSVFMGHFINVNEFSLHAMYRNRLVRAYLAASHLHRRFISFTGLDATDDVKMSAMRGQRPLHVLNLALNVVSSRRLSWQQRKARSFTVTPLRCGNLGLGYRDSATYGGGISLGTALAISGAAASPNMGYHSSPFVSFTMMLFNARLGWWLGNPGEPGDRSWPQPGPRSAVRMVVREMLGLTDDQGPYVYLSDGGHFENLALYEMVLRRCRTIVVLDGGCDPDFTYEDLGNALRKIRIDHGIPIDFEPASLRALVDKQQRFAVAAIRYSAVDEGAPDGRLVYLKPMLVGDEPPDVASYAQAHATFPHETTSNQWFNEAQTESYRALGLHTIDSVCAGDGAGTVHDLAQAVDAVSPAASVPRRVTAAPGPSARA